MTAVSMLASWVARTLAPFDTCPESARVPLKARPLVWTQIERR
ncbi:hypothetical protein JCM19241_3275 [Vibrio ishigakensis]|uniref:Uncharacterized protein n=1 Tax=Vibrio ishigakensis TaxID=1481914 RepID=A0A0B8QJT1_9VIBR|nr:hypothetical protein JCM19241_3275 [Vibrio ishigakensis]